MTDDLRIVGFDWCGKAGAARYLAGIALVPDTGWHDGVRRTEPQYTDSQYFMVPNRGCSLNRSGKEKKHDRGSTRNYNLLIRSQTRYHYATRPLGGGERGGLFAPTLPSPYRCKIFHGLVRRAAIGVVSPTIQWTNDDLNDFLKCLTTTRR